MHGYNKNKNNVTVTLSDELKNKQIYLNLKIIRLVLPLFSMQYTNVLHNWIQNTLTTVFWEVTIINGDSWNLYILV